MKRSGNSDDYGARYRIARTGARGGSERISTKASIKVIGIIGKIDFNSEPTGRRRIGKRNAVISYPRSPTGDRLNSSSLAGRVDMLSEPPAPDKRCLPTPGVNIQVKRYDNDSAHGGGVIDWLKLTRCWTPLKSNFFAWWVHVDQAKPRGCSRW